MTLLQGHVQTTYGTDFDCIAEHILAKHFDKAVVLTDGYATLAEAKQTELKERRLQLLTILFGGKTTCEEFAPLGDTVQLQNVTDCRK